MMAPEPGLLVVRGGAMSLLVARRSLYAILTLLAALALAVAVALSAGPAWLSPSQLADVFGGDAPGGTRLMVLEFRLPRVLTGVLAGASLGLAGSLIQTLTRNRLASPDMLGVADGAMLGVFIALIAGTTGMLGPWWVGPLGALGAVALLLLASGPLDSRGHRLLVVGIAIASLLRAGAELVLSQQELMHASALYAWSIGSLSGRTWGSALPLAVALAVLLPPALLASRRLALLRFDPDVATSLGLPVRATQWQVLLCAVLLAGMAVGVCGPIAFVALAAPFIGERLVGYGRGALLASALCGALLVAAADTLGRVILGDAELPVGVICNLLGGPFLLYLLLHERNGETP